MRQAALTASFYGGRGFSLYHAVGERTRIPSSPHFHDEYLIAAQLRGEEQCHVSGRLHQFSAGDVVLINPQQVHTGNAAGEDIEYISLYLDRGLVRRFAQDLGAPVESPEFTVVRASGRAQLVGAMERLLDLVQRDARNAVEIESGLMFVVSHAFEELSNLKAPRLRSTNRVGQHRIARVIDYIRELPSGAEAGAMALDRMAEVAGLSKYHFLRQFQHAVGMTPGAYLRTLRLCQGARLLRSSDRPIVDIALAVGFADHPSFSRAFARQMGMTPTAYRRLGPL